MITKQDYQIAIKKLDYIANAHDVKSWNLLMLNMSPDKELQKTVNDLCDICGKYEEQQNFYELLESGDYRTA